MNNNFVKIAFVGLACAAFCTTTFAAPKGGHHGSSGRPARAPQQTRAPQCGYGRPAPQQTRVPRGSTRAPQQTRAPQGGYGRPARAPQQTRAPQGARPATKPNAVQHAAPARHVSQPAFGRQGHFGQEPRHHAPSHHGVRHHIPSHARYWARPAVPMWHDGGLRAWVWVEQEWVIVVNGVYYYGDGYYYDGYNYFYNGEYHTVPPPLPAPVYF